MISGLGGGDLGTQIAMMQIQSGESEKDISNGMRKDAEAEERQDDAKEYEATEAKATAAMWSGVVAGVGEGVAAGFSIAGANATASGQSESLSKGLVARGQLYDAMAKVGSAVLNGQSVDDGADAEKAKEAADQAKSVADDARGYAKDEQDGIDKAITFAGDYDNSENQAAQAALHRA